jgi:hypothetical protein
VNLLQQLDAALPGWRKEYDNDPIAAATDLGLIDPEDSEPDAQALDFHDERANWARVVEAEEDE